MSCGYFVLNFVSTLYVVDVLWNMHILPWIARWMHQTREIEEVVKLILETKLLSHLDRSLTGRKFETTLKLCTWHIEQQKIISQMEEMLRGWPHSMSGRKYLSNPESHFSVQGPLILPLLTSCSIYFVLKEITVWQGCWHRYAEFPTKSQIIGGPCSSSSGPARGTLHSPTSIMGGV